MGVYNIAVTIRGERKKAIKYALLDYLRGEGYTIVSVSGYGFDIDGRENYLIHFEMPAADGEKVDNAIDRIYEEVLA